MRRKISKVFTNLIEWIESEMLREISPEEVVIIPNDIKVCKVDLFFQRPREFL